MKTAIPLIWIMMLAMTASHALAQEESFYLLKIGIDKNFEVTGYDISMLDRIVGSDFISDPIELGMRVEIQNAQGALLFSKMLRPSFLILSNPPKESEKASELLQFPYYPNARYLKVYDNQTEKLSIDLQADLCDNNQACEGFENYYSCPGDCPINSQDGTCAGVSQDGGCDPDCPASIDADCSCPNQQCEDWEGREFCPQDCPSGREDYYCDGENEGICDPDCLVGEDPDCEITTAQVPADTQDNTLIWYAVIAILVILIVIMAVRLKGKKQAIQQPSYRTPYPQRV
jgi:hypothetical protein